MLAPVSVPDFLDQYWPDRPCLVPPRKRISEITASPPLTDLFAKIRRQRIGALSRGGIEQSLPALRTLVREIAFELGTPQSAFGCDAHAYPRGTDTTMGFAARERFILQIRGVRRCKIAPNRNLSYPYFDHRVGSAIAAEAAGMSSTWPSEMPDDAVTLTLKAGSLLFLPRGYWYEAETLADSLVLEFGFVSRPAVDFILSFLRSELLADENWRRPAFGFFRAPDRKRSEQRVEVLKKSLKLKADSLTVDGLLGSVRTVVGRRFRTRSRLTIRFARIRGGRARAIVVRQGKPAGELVFDSKWVPLLKWIIRQTDPFTVAEASANLRGFENPSVVAISIFEILREKKIIDVA